MLSKLAEIRKQASQESLAVVEHPLDILHRSYLGEDTNGDRRVLSEIRKSYMSTTMSKDVSIKFENTLQRWRPIRDMFASILLFGEDLTAIQQATERTLLRTFASVNLQTRIFRTPLTR